MAKEYEIDIEDVEIINNDIEGWLVATDNGVTVALDTTLTEDLIQEGIAREFVSRIQNLRKDSGFEVTDRITISVDGAEPIINALKTKNDYICNETLCNQIDYISLPRECEIDFLDEQIKIKVIKCST